MTMEREELHDLLERLWDRYDREEFISADPIAVPHCFASRDDREIAGFLAATIAWGSRPMIVRNGLRMMHFLDDAPHDFVRNASERELAKLSGFVHRTFNGGDLIQFVRSIRAICERHGGLGRFVEASYASTGDMRRVLAAFREEFFRTEHPERCRKHVSSIERCASCKRLCMYFRWMVRHDDRGVDFGLWRTIPPSALYLPLDLHTGNMGRALGLLARRQNDWRAVEEITAALRTFDADGVLLGAWVALGAADRLLLDVGTSTGVIALMLAQRSPAAGVTALDIDAACAEQARANADRSPWGGRVTTCCAPVQEYRPEEPFDLVVSNPPYYDRSLLPPDAGRTTARHTVALTHGELIAAACRLLAPEGRLAVILPAVEAQRFREQARGRLALRRLTEVWSTPRSGVKRCLMEFVRGDAAELRTDRLVIEEAPGRFTEEYRRLTGDFYLKF